MAPHQITIADEPHTRYPVRDYAPMVCMCSTGAPDKDPKTKKSWWYTRGQTHKTTRLEVPEEWKRDFASKQLTCGECLATVLLIHFN